MEPWHHNLYQPYIETEKQSFSKNAKRRKDWSGWEVALVYLLKKTNLKNKKQKKTVSLDAFFYKEYECMNISVMQVPWSQALGGGKLLKIAVISDSTGSRRNMDHCACLDTPAKEPAWSCWILTLQWCKHNWWLIIIQIFFFLHWYFGKEKFQWQLECLIFWCFQHSETQFPSHQIGEHIIFHEDIM